MTKSKIFLSGTAFVLAIAGAFASKASNKFSAIVGFTGTNAQNCTRHPEAIACFTSAVGATCKTNSNVRTLKTSKCVKTLHTTPNE
jgi:hypothetical protein